MKWYWILLIVIAYIPIGGILEGLLERWNIFEGDVDDGLGVITVLLWPLMFPFCILITVAELLSQWVSGNDDDDDDD